MSSFSLGIARRYLVARRTLQFISVITFLSLTGITVGVAAIICVSSIFNGFRDVYQSSMVAYDPHIRVVASAGAWLGSDTNLMQKLRTWPGVNAVEMVVGGRAIVSAHNTFHIVQLHGVDPRSYSHVSGIARSMVVGEFRATKSGELPGLVVGAEFANAANVDVNDTLSLLSPNFIESALQSLMSPQGYRCVVRGIFYTNSKEYNAGFAYCDQELARQLFGAQSTQVSSYDLRVDEIDNAESIAEKMRSSITASCSIETWYDLHKDLYSVMRFERIASFVILSLIVLVSVFNIFAMLSMTIVRKRPDIGILMTMGATPNDIQRIFLQEGLLIGIIGTLAGLVLGLGLCEAQIHFKLLRFDPQSFIVNAIPVQIAWPDVIAISILTIVFSFLATIVPARRAASTKVSEALRSE